jgi:hypothetical protein
MQSILGESNRERASKPSTSAGNERHLIHSTVNRFTDDSLSGLKDSLGSQHGPEAAQETDSRAADYRLDEPTRLREDKPERLHSPEKISPILA